MKGSPSKLQASTGPKGSNPFMGGAPSTSQGQAQKEFLFSLVIHKLPHTGPVSVVFPAFLLKNGLHSA